MIAIPAPAKINLTLEVLSKRADSHHELRSVIQAISLSDTLNFENSHETVFRSESTVWEAEKSLLPKVIELFREKTGISKGVSITVEKRIPMTAGLGGDSSDAAAVLKGLNEVWNTGLSREELHLLAEQLGSDVPFFLYGGTALMEGRGEKVTPLTPVPKMYLVLVVPEIDTLPGKTGKLYSSLGENDYTDGTITRNWVEAIEKGSQTPELFNVFGKIAFQLFPGLEKVKEEFQKLSEEKIHLAGSGPVLFTVMNDRTEAEELQTGLKKRKLRSVIASSVP